MGQYVKAQFGEISENRFNAATSADTTKTSENYFPRMIFW